MQWAISIGRFDNSTAQMTLMSFGAMPCQGRMDRAKCTYSYLARIKGAVISTNKLEIAENFFDWFNSVYWNVR
jgi:hypothetical protein